MNARAYFILILCIFVTNCSKSNQQNNKTSVDKKEQVSNNHDNELPLALVKGILRDHNNQPLPRANIQVNKINDLQVKPLGAASTFSGEYLVRIPVNKDSISIRLIFTYSSYKPDTNIVQIASGDTIKMNHRFELK